MQRHAGFGRDLHTRNGVLVGQPNVDFTSRSGWFVNSHALAVLAPFVGAEVMRHVEAGEGAGSAEVGVHGEESFAEIGGRFEVGEDVGEEVGGGGEGGVFVLIGIIFV